MSDRARIDTSVGREEMDSSQLEGKVVDSRTRMVYNSVEDYRQAVGGDTEPLGKYYHLIQEKALARGAARAKAKEDSISRGR